jgi:hypothetical protein
MPSARRTRSPCAKGKKHTAVAPGSPGLPARNGFNGFLRALLGDRLVVTIGKLDANDPKRSSAKDSSCLMS